MSKYIITGQTYEEAVAQSDAIESEALESLDKDLIIASLRRELNEALSDHNKTLREFNKQSNKYLALLKKNLGLPSD